MGLPIELPPLRHRDNDVIILSKFFIEEFAKSNKSKIMKLHETAKTKLRKYDWPGNVRELKAVIDLACVMADGKEILADDLTFYQIGDLKPYTDGDKSLKEYEIEIITNYLKQNENNVVMAADKLGIAKSKIYNMLKSGEIKLK